MPTATSRILFVLLFHLFAMNVFSQTAEIRFRVTDASKTPVSFATITAIRYDDSTRVFRRSADSAGVCIMRLQTGMYIVRINALNFQPIEKRIMVKSDAGYELETKPLVKTMEDVTVTSTRPLMRQDADMTIIEPEPLVAASTNAFEVLEKTPGIFVDQDGNVYLSSTTPSAIYINGREMKMSTADIATMLKNLPPNSIARIEILRSPSAKYDASGTGGIINIVLKKGVKPGMTGSVTTAAQQGVYGNQMASFNLNNNNGRQTTYINANYSRRNSYERIITDRNIGGDTVLSQDAFTRYQSPAWYLGYGYNTALTSKFDFDFSGNVTYNRFNNSTGNISSFRKGGETPFAGFENLITNTGHNFYIGNGVEGKFRLDTTGSEWESDLWYSYSNSVAAQDYYGGGGTSENTRHYAVAKSDVKLKMAHRFVFESGFRLSYMDFRNVADYSQQTPGGPAPDPARSNQFRYRENINAAYIQGSKTLGKNFILKFGVRGEQTVMNGHQFAPGDTAFSVNRADLFPYIYLSKKVMTIAGYELRAYLVYRRTLSRPSYEYLNPFARYIDQFMYESGNPALRPQFTRNYEANISVDERPLIAIGVNETKDIFTSVVYEADTAKLVTYRTYDNLGRNKEFYIRGLGAIPPGKKYFFVVGGQYNHNFYEGLYEQRPLSMKRGTWTFFTYHQLKLGRRSQLTVNGFMRLKGLQQFYELGPFGALNATINRQFLRQKLVVTLSVNDIFETNHNEFSIRQGSINATGHRFADTRRFGINIRYNFGIRKREERQPDMFDLSPVDRGSSTP
ncbi:MAG TPA: outer membrane beta-barrel protein [Chitinophagaceae bacterium]